MLEIVYESLHKLTKIKFQLNSLINSYREGECLHYQLGRRIQSQFWSLVSSLVIPDLFVHAEGESKRHRVLASASSQGCKY